MIVRFPFKDSRTVRFSFYADNLPKFTPIEPDPENNKMMIRSNDGIPAYLRIYDIFNKIYMVLKASNLVPTSMALQPSLNVDYMALRAQNNLPVWMTISEEVAGAIGMMIRAQQTTPTIFIDMMRTSLAEAGFKIKADEVIPLYNKITPDFNKIVFQLKADGSVTVGPITEGIELCRDAIMRIGDSLDGFRIGEIDAEHLADVDPNELLKYEYRAIDPSIATEILTDGDGHAELVIKSDVIDQHILLDITHTAVFNAWLKMHANDDVENVESVDAVTNPIHSYLKTDDGITIGPIDISLDQIEQLAMQLADSEDKYRIGGLDDQLIGILDQGVLPQYQHRDVDLHLEIGALKDDDGRIRLVLRAADDVGTVRGMPVTIGYLDEMTTESLDTDAIPDYIYLEN